MQHVRFNAGVYSEHRPGGSLQGGRSHDITPQVSCDRTMTRNRYLVPTDNDFKH